MCVLFPLPKLTRVLGFCILNLLIDLVVIQWCLVLHLLDVLIKLNQRRDVLRLNIFPQKQGILIKIIDLKKLQDDLVRHYVAGDILTVLETIQEHHTSCWGLFLLDWGDRQTVVGCRLFRQATFREILIWELSLLVDYVTQQSQDQHRCDQVQGLCGSVIILRVDDAVHDDQYQQRG